MSTETADPRRIGVIDLPETAEPPTQSGEDHEPGDAGADFGAALCAISRSGRTILTPASRGLRPSAKASQVVPNVPAAAPYSTTRVAKSGEFCLTAIFRMKIARSTSCAGKAAMGASEQFESLRQKSTFPVAAVRTAAATPTIQKRRGSLGRHRQSRVRQAPRNPRHGKVAERKT